MLSNESDPEILETWILQRILRFKWMVGHIAGDVDLVEDPEIHMAAELGIRQHGSCRVS